MPELSSSPSKLKAFHFHGVDVSLKNGMSQAMGTCPFCGSVKFFVNAESGEWDCKVCGKRGNLFTFFRQLWEESDKATTDYTPLSKDRKLIFPETLAHWGVAKSIISGEWLVPGYMPDGKLNQLYRYVQIPGKPPGKRRLELAPETNHQLHGMTQWDASKPDVYICEGPWDGMALWEVLRHSKRDEAGITFTGSVAASMAAGANVLATPGANVFPDHWAQLLGGKRVFLLFDNDHPRTVNERSVEGAGLEGMKRVCSVLASCDPEHRPNEIHYIHWGNETWHDPALPTGSDVRDYLVAGGSEMKSRVPRLQGLLEKLRPAPPEWLVNTGTKKGVDVQPAECKSWKVLESSWRKAMKWSAGLDRGLCFALSIILSTETSGDQLWGKLIGPPSTGKSTLAEAVTVAQKYVKAKSTIRGFHSGFKPSNEGGGKAKDSSLIDELRNKTLITKDGDTLLQAPNLGQILAEARDIYDRTSRTHYRNEMGKDYAGINMTWILCGTESLREIDQSELGQRFLDCVIMKGVDDAAEDEIMDRVALRVIRNMHAGKEGLKTGKGVGDEALLKAYQLTGGYIEYLKDNGDDLLAAVDVPDESIRMCKRFAKFVAHLRARPSEKQDESAGREFSTRLLSQLLRLSMCLAAVRGETSVEGRVLEYTRGVALDTSRGKTFDILTYLHELGTDGGETKSMAMIVNIPEPKLRDLLIFMKQLEMIETFTRQVTVGLQGRARWRMTDRMKQLWSDVVVQPEQE